MFQAIRVKPVGNALLLLGIGCRVFTQHGEALLPVISRQAEVFPAGSELEVGVPFITGSKSVLTGGEDDQKLPRLQGDCGQCPLVGHLPVIGQVMPGKTDGRGGRVPQLNPVRALSIRVQAAAVIVSHELTDEQVIKCRHGRGAFGIIRVVTEAYLQPVLVAVAVAVGHQRVGAVGKDLLPVIELIAVCVGDHRVGGGVPVGLLPVIETVIVAVGKDRAGTVLVKLRKVGKPVAVAVGKVRVGIEVEFLAVDEPVVIGIIPAGLAKTGKMGQLPGVRQRVSIGIIGRVYPVLKGDIVHLHSGLLVGCRQLQGKIGVGLVDRGREPDGACNERDNRSVAIDPQVIECGIPPVLPSGDPELIPRGRVQGLEEGVIIITDEHAVLVVSAILAGHTQRETNAPMIAAQVDHALGPTVRVEPVGGTRQVTRGTWQA